jgi:hypothetical protein
LAEEISRQHHIQAVAWIVLAAVSQVYSENWEPTVKQKDLRKVQFGQKGSMIKVADKKGTVVNEISSFKKKSGTIRKMP